MRAFTTYVRPILEYASSIWSPYHINEIKRVESVQRQFTMRLYGLSKMNYADRLTALGLETLERRRLRADIIYLYKILFGIVHVQWNSVFKLYDSNTYTRGHGYRLFVNYCRVGVAKYFYCNRIAKIWNNLPAKPADFTSIKSFRKFVYALNLPPYVAF